MAGRGAYLRYSACLSLFANLAGEDGIEPSLTASKAVLLPLQVIPQLFGAPSRIRTANYLLLRQTPLPVGIKGQNLDSF